MAASTNIFKITETLPLLPSHPSAPLFYPSPIISLTSIPPSATKTYVDLHLLSSPLIILNASITIRPAMIAFVVAIAGMISTFRQRRKEKEREEKERGGRIFPAFSLTSNRLCRGIPKM